MLLASISNVYEWNKHKHILMFNLKPVQIPIKLTNKKSAQLTIAVNHHQTETNKQKFISTTQMNSINTDKRFTNLTSVTVEDVMDFLVYLPLPCVNFNDLYNLLNLAVQYLLYLQIQLNS